MRWRGLFAAVLWLFGSGIAAAACAPDVVDLRGSWGQAQFSVQVADTAAKRERGLMHVPSMPRRSGMIFFYEAPLHARFWMKNTLIPLDMIFADQTGLVKHVHANAIPGDLTPIDGGTGILAVLEINGGLAEVYGITAGTQLRHPLFAQDTAIWPC